MQPVTGMVILPATIKMLFDWLILGQVLELYPAAAVLGPRHIVKKRKRPVLLAEAALGMDVGEYYRNGKRWWFRHQEEGGNRRSM